MMEFKFDSNNFTITEMIDVVKVPVDVIDNRTHTETTLLMLMLMDEYRDRVKDICQELGYSVLMIGTPMKWKVDLNTIAVVE